MTRVHRLEHVERLRASDLAHDDAVGAHSQGVAYELANAHLALAFEVGENGGETGEPTSEEPASEEEIIELMKGTFDAREVSDE